MIVVDFKKLDPNLSYSLKKYQSEQKKGLTSLKAFLGIESKENNPKPARIAVFLECDEITDFSNLEKYGIKVNQKKGKIRTAFFPIDKIQYLQQDSRIKSIRSSKYLQLKMDVARGKVYLPQFLKMYHLTGEGVIIGIVDSGIDPNHPAFKGRILRIWDQELKGPGVLEGKYGLELKGDLLTTSRDTIGHGTHVAGIAAGSNSSQYAGNAANSNLVIVKTDLQDTHISDGVRYVFRVAKEEGFPAVCNLSLGGHDDAHDGTDDLCRIIDEESGPGRIVCCAAGNEGDDDIHSQINISKNKSSLIKFHVPENLELLAVNCWYYGKDEVEIAVRSPSSLATPYQGILADREPQEYTLLDGTIAIMTPPPDPYNHDHQIMVYLLRPNKGLWQLEIKAKKISSASQREGIRVDAWLIDQTGNTFFKGNVTDTIKIGSPGSASEAITIGSFTTKVSWKDINNNTQKRELVLDDVSAFSNEGPLRKGKTLKPDLVAPGAVIAAPMSADTQFVRPENMLNNYYRIMSGTSMATPFISGIIALLLEKNKSLKPLQIKEIFRKSSKIKGQKGSRHDIKWGYGLIDASKLSIADGR